MSEVANAATAAIQFAVQTNDGISFLRCWQEGDFASIRREWPDAPPGVYGGHAKIRPIRYHKPASYVEVCMHASWL